jgi:hypothetical protein
VYDDQIPPIAAILSFLATGLNVVQAGYTARQYGADLRAAHTAGNAATATAAVVAVRHRFTWYRSGASGKQLADVIAASYEEAAAADGALVYGSLSPERVERFILQVKHRIRHPTLESG